MFKVLVINPPSLESLQANRDFMGGFGATNVKGVTRVPSLMVEYVAGILRANGFDADTLDLAIEDDPQKAERQIGNVSLIGLYCGTATFQEDLEFADRLKARTGAFIFMFGPQVSVTPDFALRHEALDALIIGEPEYSALELAGRVRAGKSDLSEIRGVWWREGGKVVRNLPRERESDPDKFPFPYRRLEYANKYFYRPNENPFITVLASRGCPYNCLYCPYPVSQGTTFRPRTPQNVITELQLEKKRVNYKMILFRDPVFSFQRERTIELCRRLKAEIGVPWRCETTCANVDGELLGIMRDAGCSGINFGIETGSPVLIKKYAAKTGGLERIKQTFADCRRLGIATTAFFIVGLPGETRETLRDTLKLALQIDPDEINFTTATPFPGTALHELLVKEGKIRGDEYASFRVYECVTAVAGMSAGEIQRELLQMYLRFYLRPGRLLRELRSDPLLFIRKGWAMLQQFRKKRN
jgi:anaerobic magnesium-protoporphyrin IX monomethyl ester cyclase